MLSRLQLILLLSSVLCEQMDWGENPYLVDESVTIQGREHIKVAMVMVGVSIELECQVAFTSEPVSKVRWKIDGKLTNDAENQTEEIKNGEIFVEAHLKIVNITADMDGSTVSCEYSKGQYGASVETVFRVFSAELNIPEKVCNSHSGDVKLTFKESKRTSLAEETANEKIKLMIVKTINVTENEITVDDSGYFINLPITAVYGNQSILHLQPKTMVDGTHVEDWFTKCNPTKTTTTTTHRNQYTEDMVNHTENEQSLQVDNKDSPKTGFHGYVILFCAVAGLLFLLVAVMITKKMGREKILSIFSNLSSRRTDAEEQCLFYYCSYCNFKTDIELDFESHNVNYQKTHSTLDYNDYHQEVQLELLKMTDSGLTLGRLKLTEKQKEYLENK